MRIFTISHFLPCPPWLAGVSFRLSFSFCCTVSFWYSNSNVHTIPHSSWGAFFSVVSVIAFLYLLSLVLACWSLIVSHSLKFDGIYLSLCALCMSCFISSVFIFMWLAGSHVTSCSPFHLTLYSHPPMHVGAFLAAMICSIGHIVLFHFIHPCFGLCSGCIPAFLSITSFFHF